MMGFVASIIYVAMVCLEKDKNNISEDAKLIAGMLILLICTVEQVRRIIEKGRS